jgi:hypothetical protein
MTQITAITRGMTSGAATIPTMTLIFNFAKSQLPLGPMPTCCRVFVLSMITLSIYQRISQVHFHQREREELPEVGALRVSWSLIMIPGFGSRMISARVAFSVETACLTYTPPKASFIMSAGAT